MSDRHQQALTVNRAHLALVLAGVVFAGYLAATRVTVAILFGVAVLGVMCAAFAIQHYVTVTNVLVFLNIALITLSIYAFPLPGGFDLQLNRVPVLIAIPFWLMPCLFPPYRPLRLRFSWAFLWYGFLAVYVLLSTVLLSDNSRTAVSQLAALVFRGALFVWLPQVIVNRRHLSLASKALIVSGAIVIVFAVFQYGAWVTKWGMEGYRFVIPFSNIIGMQTNTIRPTGRIGTLFRLTLPFGSSSHLAPCIAALLFTAMGPWLHWSKSERLRALFLAGFCLVMLGLLLGTYSRGAWVGFAAGLLTMVLYQKRLLLKRRVWRAVLVVMVILGILFASLLPFVDTVLSRLDLEQTQGSDETHLKFFLWAFDLFSSSPIVGIGWANYEARTGVLHAHNMYMTILAEGGLMGLALWLLLCGAIVRHGIRALRASRSESFLRYWNLGLLAAFVSILVDNLFQTSMYFGFPWVIAGLIIASYYITVREVKEAQAQRRDLEAAR